MQNTATRVIAVFMIMTEYRVIATRLCALSIRRRRKMQTDSLTKPTPIVTPISASVTTFKNSLRVGRM